MEFLPPLIGVLHLRQKIRHWKVRVWTHSKEAAKPQLMRKGKEMTVTLSVSNENLRMNFFNEEQWSPPSPIVFFSSCIFMLWQALITTIGNFSMKSNGLLPLLSNCNWDLGVSGRVRKLKKNIWNLAYPTCVRTNVCPLSVRHWYHL